MKLLQIKSEIHKFDNCKDFSEFFGLGEGDLILTNEIIFNRFLRGLNLKAEVMFREKYGKGEPSDEMIDVIIKDMVGKQFKRIIAIGGGSIVDIAKLIVLKGSSKISYVFENNVPIIKDKQLIIVPTTCGTGSEVTNISVVEIKAKKTKMAIAVDELFADYAVLIPELVRDLPYKFFVTSSIDALIHAIESYVSPRSNCYTELFNIKAIDLILKGYQEIISKGEDYRKEIIEDFIIGSNYAGIGFGNTGVGAVHGLSYPLGANYHVPHGEANYQMFIAVFKNYNSRKPEGKIKEINKILSDILHCDASDVYEELDFVLDKLLAKKPLREYGMKEEEIEVFTDSVITSKQRLLDNSYVALTREDILEIYKTLF